MFRRHLLAQIRIFEVGVPLEPDITNLILETFVEHKDQIGIAWAGRRLQTVLHLDIRIAIIQIELFYFLAGLNDLLVTQDLTDSKSAFVG